MAFHIHVIEDRAFFSIKNIIKIETVTTAAPSEIAQQIIIFKGKRVNLFQKEFLFNFHKAMYKPGMTTKRWSTAVLPRDKRRIINTYFCPCHYTIKTGFQFFDNFLFYGMSFIQGYWRIRYTRGRISEVIQKLFKFYSKIILWQRYAAWLRAYRPCIHSQWSVS